MIELDRKSVSALLQEKGLVFTELGFRDSTLFIGLPGKEVQLEVLLYISAIVDGLGLKNAWVTVNGQGFPVGKELIDAVEMLRS